MFKSLTRLFGSSSRLDLPAASKHRLRSSAADDRKTAKAPSAEEGQESEMEQLITLGTKMRYL
jgi:hypothetical protein